MRQQLCILLAFYLTILLVVPASPFNYPGQRITPAASSKTSRITPAAGTRTSHLAAVDTPFLPTLTTDTLWSCRLTFTANSLRTRNNKVPLIRTFVCDDLVFTPLENYEPPTGSAKPAHTTESLISEITFKLSEDPDDQKDGLWIWGLFKEPLYPYCLLDIKTNDYTLGGEDSLPPMTLYAKLPHKMEKVESNKEGRRQVLLGNADLVKKTPVEMKADPVGLAKVTLYDEVRSEARSICGRSVSNDCSRFAIRFAL